MLFLFDYQCAGMCKCTRERHNELTAQAPEDLYIHRRAEGKSEHEDPADAGPGSLESIYYVSDVEVAFKSSLSVMKPQLPL